MAPHKVLWREAAYAGEMIGTLTPGLGQGGVLGVSTFKLNYDWTILLCVMFNQ